MVYLPPVITKKNILEEFDRFRSRIEPTEKEKEDVSASHRKMRDLLENTTDLNVVDTFLTGSYFRQTMIRPLDDVDFFVQLHYDVHGSERPRQLLVKIARVLRRAYPLSPIGITPPCVYVKFKYCKFEVVPAFIYEDNADHYIIPSAVPANKWEMAWGK